MLIAGTNENIFSLGKYLDKLHGVEYETMRRELEGSPGNKRYLSPTAQTQGTEGYAKKSVVKLPKSFSSSHV